MQPTIKLHKHLATLGHGSRRDIEELIRKKQITVNGTTAHLGQRVTGDEDIRINGKPVTSKTPEKVLIAFHKPVGVETTLKKLKEKREERKTILTSPLAGGIKGGSYETAPLKKGEASNLFKKQGSGGFIKKDKKSKILNQVQDDKNKTLAHFNFGPHRLFPVGRLDKDSHGLLLMTNDGDLAFRLTHPKFEHEKEYIVVVNKKIDQKVIHTLSNGVIEIDGKPVNPCLVEKLGPKVLRILLTEGRNRQIRRMCEVCELKVVELLRTRIENIKLGDIKEGQWKTVKKSEYKVLREKVFCN